MPTSSWKAGDRVIPRNDGGLRAEVIGRVFIVERPKATKVLCRAEDGGRGIDWPADRLVAATDQNLQIQRFTEVPFYTLGEVVTLKRSFRDITPDTPMVVTSATGANGRVNVAKLGGDNDRYMRVAVTGLVRRDLAWLLSNA